MIAALRAAGFGDASHHQLSGGITQLLLGTRDVIMRAVTRPLEGVLDLNDLAGGDGFLFVRDGVGVAGRGVAARVAVRRSRRRCSRRSSTSDVPAAGGPVAIGVMPFLPDAPAELVIPSTVVRKCADGTAWVTLIDDAEQPLGRSPARPTAASYDIRPAVDVVHYLPAVEAARDMVRTGEIVKAVIARPITVTCDRPIDVHAVLGRLRASFGSSYRYSVDGFIGASPELLVAVDGDVIRRTRSLAPPRSPATRQRRVARRRS